MHTMFNRNNRRHLVQAGLCLLLVGLVLPAAWAQSIRIAATVNDEVITTTDVDDRVALTLSATNLPMTDETKKQMTPRILQSLIDEVLEVQEAKKQVVTVTDNEVAAAIDDIGKHRDLPPGGLKKKITEQGLSMRSLENEVRAQLLWNKVVQRKLRRNVTISQDEIARAQQVEVASPGLNEVHVAALQIPITANSKEADVKKLVGLISDGVKAGSSLSAIAAKYVDRSDLIFSPPVWLTEESLPPDIRRTLHETKEGTVTQPLRSGNSIQFIELMGRRVTKLPPSGTEFTIKQITFTVPAKLDKPTRAKLTASADILHKNGGSCEDASIPETPLKPEVAFSQPTIDKLSPEQGSMLSRLQVGEVSEPLLSTGSMRLVVLCEKREPTGAAANPNSESVRQKIFAEKLELEAQKHLRNLRREATIDIRSGE